MSGVHEQLPRFLEPMLLKSGTPPADVIGDWAVEVKWDGIRGQVRVDPDGSVCVRSRPGRDCSSQFPELAAIAAALAGRSVLLDGEIICLDDTGRPRFEHVQARVRACGQRAIAEAARRFPVTFMAFDVLHLDGESTRHLPYSRRRQLLEDLELRDGPTWRVPRCWPADDDDLVKVTAEHGLEGVVFKKLSAPYEAGRRGGAWLKFKHRRSTTVAVTGWAPGELGELDEFLVARRDGDGGLVPAGRVKFGLDSDGRVQLREQLVGLHRGSRNGIRWVTPAIELDVHHHGAPDGPLRDGIISAARKSDVDARRRADAGQR